MINFTHSLNTKMTKQEKENSRQVTIFFKYEKLMKEAKKSKADYLYCKAKDPLNLDDKNRIALSNLIIIFKEDAIAYWNKAEALRNEYPFLDEMIASKK
mgnify:CR=1 FL=1